MDMKKNVYIYMYVLKMKIKSGFIDVCLVWYLVYVFIYLVGFVFF